ncbi:hypothetical protein B9Z55_020515 [Caenorhabditis nigoni]|uniref:Uncharacterized protein n=1 Tax=Caenorhabditis nigoni TaxID=1611254 RepID=A0A2G5TNJ6_9PELO|nr:hypothetical protein B9Z55_020515 [Caenorhabditis nigoni]
MTGEIIGRLAKTFGPDRTKKSSANPEDGAKHINVAQRRAASSPTSTDADAMNGRSISSKATLEHGQQPDQLTNGTWKVVQLLEGNTIDNLYAVMDEQPSHQRQQLDEEVYR